MKQDLVHRIQDRRSFLRKCSVLSLLPFVEQASNSHIFPKPQRRKITIVDKERIFVSDNQKTPRPIPDEFKFGSFPKIPEVPDTLEVKYPWSKENFANFKERALNDLGGINEGIYGDGQNILQIMPTTPATPDTKDGSAQYKCWYRLSADGGKSFSDFRLVVVEGQPDDQPIKGVKIGRNGFTVPLTSPFVKSSNGEIMIPIHLSPWDESGHKIYNPADAFMFGDSGVLIAEWINNYQDIRWTFGDWLRIDHQLSTRGLFEPSIAELSPGRFAMVMRGSNYTKPHLPSYSWLSFSNDYCRTWSKPERFSYSDGEPFYVPAACSTLLRSAHNRNLYWIGNISEQNPNGNSPRYPLVIGRVDEKKFGLIKDSVVMIDNRDPERDDPPVELSNFKILERADRTDIIVALTRREKGHWAKAPSWYQIKLS